MLRYFVLFAVLAALSAGYRHTPHNAVDFATSFYQKTVEDHKGDNVLISPLAIRIALGLVYMGAEGKTAEELVTGQLLTTRDKTTNADKLKQLLDIHSSIHDVKMANKIYAKESCTFKNAFIEIAQNKFKSEIETLNFGDIDTAVETINNWILTKTNDEIEDLIKKSELNADAEIILANAFTFHGSFEKTFDKRQTSEKPFYTTTSGTVNTEMMSMSSKVLFKSSEELNVDVIRLPYTTDGLYMLIMLPREQDGLRNLEKSLNQINLLYFAESMVDEVDYDEIRIPKFKIDYKMKLKPVLEKMDMTTMYTDDADFSKMVEEDVKISKIITKSLFEVTEEGTEPGTVQAMRNVEGPQAKKFIADHPFFYAVMNEYGILVAGRYIHPEE